MTMGSDTCSVAEVGNGEISAERPRFMQTGIVIVLNMGSDTCNAGEGHMKQRAVQSSCTLHKRFDSYFDFEPTAGHL